MLGTYFYHEVIRKTIIGFGTLFNNMEVRHETSDGTTVDIKRVPLAYGPAAKFIARLEQQPDLNKMVAITLPRIQYTIQVSAANTDKDKYDHSDEIEDEADQILDFTESNPFGLF